MDKCTCDDTQHSVSSGSWTHNSEQIDAFTEHLEYCADCRQLIRREVPEYDRRIPIRIFSIAQVYN